MAARNRAVHAVVIRRHAARSRKCVLAAGPEFQPFGLRGRYLAARGAGGAEYRFHPVDLVRHLFGRAIGFAQQDRLCVHVVAGAHERFDHMRGASVHHFKPCGDHAGRDHLRDRVAGCLDAGKTGHHDLRASRLGNQLDRNLGDHAQHAFGSDEDGQQVQARRVRRFGTQLDHVAVDRDHTHAQHVVHGQTVFQAMHAAGILGHIAADGTGNLAGGIGRVVQPVRRGRFRNRQIAHARLNDRRGAGQIDMLDAVELRQAQQHALAVRHGAAGQAGARAARDDRRVQPLTDAHDGLDLFFGFRQRHDGRQRAIQRQAIALVGARVLFAEQYAVRGQRGRQRLDQLLQIGSSQV
ncbi:hypothetical protein G6F22_014619 [Rhizopus arrhizus]|nr:hypothetical protein G6F22_014619 [Rhizopus arrhizus]